MDDFLEDGGSTFASSALWRHCGSKRPVILHYHLYKNAGTTIEAVLEREFGLFFSTLDTEDPNAKITSAELLAILARNDTMVAVSSHQLRYPKPLSADVEFFDICFIRHPLDRLFSQYSFLRKPNVLDPLVEAANSMDLAGFLSLLLEHYPEQSRNAQTRLLLDREDDMDARRLVRDISVLGVVELFDESVMLAEYTLHPYFPRLRMHYSPQNVTNSQEMHFDQRLDVIRARCGEQLYLRLLEANRVDLELWTAACEELKRRLHARPDHEHWLAEFRQRADVYQGRPRFRDALLKRLRITPPAAIRIRRT